MTPPEGEDLARAFEPIRRFPDFHPADRIWWLYLRQGVERWLEKHEDAGIRAAHNSVKAFPENLPDERALWLDLRAAVVQVLERHRQSSRG